MHDLPSLLQRSHSRTFSGEDLETLGKQAAQVWSNGDATTLNEAVIETVKKAGLSPEQVRRVIEFTNTSAYLGEFHKEGSLHRVIEFHGGPADPSAVLQSLNFSNEKVAHVQGTNDYELPPVAHLPLSVQGEDKLAEMFGQEGSGIPEENPFGDLIDLREKVSAMRENLSSEISSLEVMHLDLCDRIYAQVKEAALTGHSLGEIVQVWSTVTDEPVFFKTAFDMLTNRLLEGEVFPSLMKLTESIEKTGAQHMVNMEHPLLTDFQEYCDVLSKLAHNRQQLEEAEDGLHTITGILTNAGREKSAGDGGFVGKAWRGATAASKAVAEPVGRLATHLGGNEVGKGAKGLVEHAPHLGAGLLGLAAMQHLSAAASSPAARSIKSAIPGTTENAQKNWELQMQYGGIPTGQY